MARYAAASGNWNSTSTWSSGDGGPGGASVPTSADDVYIFDNRTVTLTADAQCNYFEQLGGTLNLGSYKLSVVGAFNSLGTNARTINMGSGTLEIHYANLSDEYYTPYSLNLGGSNLTFNAGTSRVIINCLLDGEYNYINTLSKSFNEFKVNLGESGYEGTTVFLSGSASFSILDIRDNNNMGHTVIFDSSNVSLRQLIAIGHSPENRINMISGIDSTTIAFQDYGTSYGENVELNNMYKSGISDAYIGSGSVDLNSGGWLIQDPPKASTLIDTMTTSVSSNSKWVVTGDGISSTTSGYNGGGYRVSEDDEGTSTTLTSSGSYDLSGSELIFEINERYGSSGGFYELNSGLGKARLGIHSIPAGNSSLKTYYNDADQATLSTVNPSTRQFIKVANPSGNTVNFYFDSTGTGVFSLIDTVSVDDITMYKSIRLRLSPQGSRTLYIGSVGIAPSSGATNTGAFFQMF